MYSDEKHIDFCMRRSIIWFQMLLSNDKASSNTAVNYRFELIVIALKTGDPKEFRFYSILVPKLFMR